ncbi:MAG TPA: Stp1/IreP family PP2C-type Ser/Thr phosphatase, partial [Ktedonobacterales bacterium]|nr:Stp1/IreP family PP2C-type Ser/Thr phosphatase [Ktedonobacterales bacterium]
GRRRERNQDNVIHFVPDDPELFERRGALFVVCDGMGGHAAGEIASEIGVQTIREQYYQDSDEDVITALARSIQSANAAIYNHAREHLAHSGMGTTCVLLTLVGGRAFFANIGDSRAYLLRNGAMRQVTRDHSWVAEQVRAGVLTEDQARTHSHRNVITRSLGTQPDVTADLFIETMRDDDRVVLCSDGLHGYVAEAEIQRVILEHEPGESARHLIDMANDNGGPDNITAVVVRLLEVPPVTDELTLPPVVAVTRESEDASMVTTLPLPRLGGGENGIAAAVGAAGYAEVGPDGTGLPSAPAAQLASSSLKHRRATWPVVALRLLAVAALLVLSAGIWDVLAGPYSVQRATSLQVQRDVASAQAAAQAATNQNPTNALASLAAARQRLQRDLATLPLDGTGRARIQQALTNDVTPAVRSALTSYNQQGMIEALPASAVASFTVSCSATLASAPSALIAVGAATAASGATAPPVTLYALTGGGAVYQLTVSSGAATCGASPVVAQGVKALASDGATLYALAQVSGGWQVLSATGSGKPSAVVTLPADGTHNPQTLAVHGGDVYVAYAGANTQDGGGIWHFTTGGATPAKLAQQVSIARGNGIAALVVAASGTPFALLLDGSVLSWSGAGQLAAVSITLVAPIQPADPQTYQTSTPVPTPPPTPTAAPPDPTPTTAQATASLSGSGTPAATTPASPTLTAAPTATPLPVTAGQTQFGGFSSLTADRIVGGTLLIGDSTLPRVVRFAVAGDSLALDRQYVYGPLLQPLQSVTVSADGSRLYAWSGGQLVEVTLPA